MLVIAIGLSLCACKKYEGPVTFRTPEQRLRGTWMLEFSGCEPYLIESMRLEKSGRATIIDGTDDVRLFWQLNEEKTELSLSYHYPEDNITITDKCEIKILTKKEMELSVLDRITTNIELDEACVDQRLIWTNID